MRIKPVIIRKLVLLLLFFSCEKIMAQQHTLFSHYNFDHFMYNPASAGYTNTLTANFFHRDQWTGVDLPPRTQFLDIHAPLRFQPFAFGGHIYNDNASFLNNVRLQLASAYQFTINETGNLGIGLGLNFQRLQVRDKRKDFSLNPPELILDPVIEQYRNAVWNFFLSPGVYYNNGKFYGGISSTQILQNNFEINKVEANTELSRRHWLIMAGYNHQLNDKWRINPSFLFRTEKASPINLDINAVITYTDLIWLNIGYRTSNMIMIGVGVSLDQMFKAGYNFDANLNSLGAANARASHEIYLGFNKKVESDLDRDGIIDRLDKCPTIKGLAKNNGCPYKDGELSKPKKAKDTDKDGIPDSKDKCPKIAGTKSNKGCPEIVAKDSDGDGTYDNEDKCPDVPGLKSNDGCPEELLDSDGDGIVDEDDKCPDVAGVKSNNGCPEIVEKEVKDSDDDGIADKEDKCPDVPGVKSNNGCPEIVEEIAKDSDDDGIADKDDKCPDVPGVKSNNGCPEIVEKEVKDSDGDGIVDEDDKCPDLVGVKSNNGCPEIGIEILKDSDGDGVIDEDDKCPDSYGTKDNNGCPEILDSDNDGIFDDKDECPDTFGIAAKKGCPDIDSDNDGILDLEDGCPNTAGVKENDGCPLSDRDTDGVPDVDDLCPDAFGFARNDGCPDAPEPVDSDGDGIPDEDDRCPDLYGVDDGCPEPPTIVDSDGDGIADNEDDCPNSYGASSNNGCPVAVQSDSDGDGIIDTLDECPFVYGTASNYGCPSETSNTNSPYKDILDAATLNLRFGSGSSNIEYSSFSTLKDLAQLMLNNPGFRLRIAGHTDNVGSPATNMDISKKRAEAVRDYLLNEGVSFGNMIVEYFGGSKPIADNNNEDGRRLNRRVDFELIEY